MSISFLRRKKVKFNVELTVLRLTEVPLLNAIIFAKVRLLDCGSFVAVTLHRPICSHEVDFMLPSSSQHLETGQIRMRAKTSDHLQPTHSNGAYRHSVTVLTSGDANALNICPTYMDRRHSLSDNCSGDYHISQGSANKLELEAEGKQEEEADEYVDEDGNVIPVEKNPQPFKFTCCIPFDSKQSGVLETCRCKISLRKEDRAGRAQKLGFVILNLAEFAGTGSEGITRSYLVDGYGGNNQRADNSRVHIFVRMQHNSADPLFKVPNSTSMFRQNGSSEDLSHATEQQLGQWLNPADRKAPPSSPLPSGNSQSTGTAGASTTSQNPSIQTDYSIPGQMVTSTSGISSSFGTSAFSSVPGGLGHNMSARVQQTRTDPGAIIDEVLAENAATLSAPRTYSVSSSSSSDQYESS